MTVPHGGERQCEAHYLTLFELTTRTLSEGDPAQGIGGWPLAAFQQSWTGHLLLLTSA